MTISKRNQRIVQKRLISDEHIIIPQERVYTYFEGEDVFISTWLKEKDRLALPMTLTRARRKWTSIGRQVSDKTYLIAMTYAKLDRAYNTNAQHIQVGFHRLLCMLEMFS